MIYKNKILIFIIAFSLLTPFFSFAETPTTPPTGTGGSSVTQSGDSSPSKLIYECGGTPGECQFQDLVLAVQKALNFGRNFALMFSVVVIAYAGFNYMISGDNPSKRSDANKMLKKVALGIIYILAAWLIVTLILNGLLVKSDVPRFLKN